MALEIMIKAVPSSGQNKWAFDRSGILKIFLKSPAEKGAANKEIIKLFSKALKIPQADISIVIGATACLKKIPLNVDFTFDEMLEKLGLQKPDKQQPLW